MTTMTTATNFSPDGMRGGAMERRHEAGHRDQRSSGARQNELGDSDYGHDYYDDGLVHDHSFHSTSNTR